MENSNYNKNRHNEHLGVNKMGKNIRKSPLHQPNFGNPNPKPQPQPQVYNISKNDFRNIVQRLTGSPSQEPPPPPQPPLPPHNPPKPASMRLQRIRPPPLTPINRPRLPMPSSVANFNAHPHAPNINNNNSPNSLYFNSRPPQQQPSLSPLPAITPPPGDSIWSNTAESPISAYMRYLQNSIDLTGSRQPQSQNQLHLSSTSGLLPTPPPARTNPPGLLPSPTSQFVLPSPSAFLNLLSPRSPYPLPLPGFQYPPLSTPNFSFSPLPRSPGILGPGPQHLPPSPTLMFPPSPSGFFPLLSPRWRDP